MLKLPKLNFRVTENFNCIDCFLTDIIKRTITKSLVRRNKRKYNKRLILEETIACFTSRTQAVERTIKIVAEAVMKTCGYEGRDIFIKANWQS